MTFEEITLLIPTHKRHFYLDRIISYYKEIPLKIIIADSTDIPYKKPIQSNYIQYRHFPGINLPQKLAAAINLISTQFVVMCADDDFIIPDGISSCLEFLKKDKKYVSAQGNCITYFKESMNENSVKFFPMYLSQLEYEISSDKVFERIQRLFINYRTLFSAIHYTKNLQLAYNDQISIRNLFLNEYLSGIIPISLGNHKELNVFFQVREYSNTSDDKSTDNLDVIVNSANYQTEYINYLNYISDILKTENHSEGTEYFHKMDSILKSYAETLINDKIRNNPGIKKRLGSLIVKIPFFGKLIVELSREKERLDGLKQIIKTTEERRSLEMIANKIKEYASSIT